MRLYRLDTGVSREEVVYPKWLTCQLRRMRQRVPVAYIGRIAGHPT
jgi:hypothetical protein